MSHWYLDYAYFNSAKCLSSTGMSSGRLSDEVAIVTGAGRNIGQTIAETFAAEGAYVIVADVDKEAATAVVDGITDAGGEAVAAATDVTDPSDVAAMIETAEEEFGPVDILINNAAINERKGLFDITIDEFDRTLETNFRGTFLCTREAAKSMEKNGGGRIVNIASATSGHVGRPDQIAYATSKSGIFNFTRSAAKALSENNIRVNTLSPSRTGSPVGDETPRSGPADDDILVNRWGDPQDQADAALFLVSDESSFVTGAELTVDGGSLA